MALLGLLPAPSALAFAVGLFVVLLGLAVTGRAYQGYRRNDSRPMLLFAIGMLLITVVPTLVELVVIPWFVARYLPAGSPAFGYTLLASRLCEAAGIATLLYSLSVRASRTTVRAVDSEESSER